MSKTIHKFTLQTVDRQLIAMPAGAETLDVEIQNGEPQLYALVDIENEMVNRPIITHGTGHPVPETTGDYIDTYQLEDGALIFHVFEEA